MSWAHVEVAELALDDFRVQFIRQISKGFQKYGTKLNTFNKRSFYKDCLEELVDAINYLKGLELQYQKVREVAWIVVQEWNMLEASEKPGFEFYASMEKLKKILELSNNSEDPINVS